MSDPLGFNIEAEGLVDIEDYEFGIEAEKVADKMWQEHLEKVKEEAKNDTLATHIHRLAPNDPGICIDCGMIDEWEEETHEQGKVQESREAYEGAEA